MVPSVVANGGTRPAMGKLLQDRNGYKKTVGYEGTGAFYEMLDETVSIVGLAS